MIRYIILLLTFANFSFFYTADAVSSKLENFIQLVRGLHAQGRLDGELLILQGDQELCHLFNQDLSAYERPQYMIGSVSKQFTAVALLRALSQDTIDIDEEARINRVKARLQQPISIFLPENSPIWSGHVPPWAHHVTLHQLLTHTSGIPNFTDTDECEKENGSGKVWWELPHTSADIIALIAGKDLLFPSGTKFSYSNTGYTILADVIEAITKKSFSEYLQEALFDPIDLKSTSSADKGRWEELSKLDRYSRLVAQGNYDPRGSQNEIYRPARSADISYGKGAGSIISTVEDLLKWNRALHKECSVLPKALYESFISPYIWEDRFGIGYGIGIGESSLGKVYQHSGSIGTYRTVLTYFPEQDLSIIVLTHIAYDSSKTINEYNELLETLKLTYPDEAERKSEVHRRIEEKYPGTRGFEKIGEFWNQLQLEKKL